jgi:hypothetical protein
MIQIIVYSFLLIVFVYTSGFFLSSVVLPTKLKPYSLLLGPWILIAFLDLLLIIMSLLGLPVKSSSLIIWFLLGLVALYSLWQKDYRLFLKKFNWSLHLISVVSVALAFAVAMLPILKYGSLTSFSLGNNDIVNYVVVSEYFLDHPLTQKVSEEALSKNPILGAVSTFVDYGYRWGSPIVFSFFHHLLSLRAYQMTHLFISLLFALSAPLVILLFYLIYPSTKKPTRKMPIALLLAILYALNVNSLYYVFHGFMAQFLSTGLMISIVILLMNLFQESYHKPSFTKFYRQEFLIGVLFFAVLTIYHEHLVFLVIPLALYALVQLLLKKNWSSIMVLIPSGLIGALILPLYTYNALKFQFKIYNIFKEPIGWGLFRSPNPYANPVEIIGLWSLHNMPVMLPIASYIFSFLVVAIILLGLLYTKRKMLLISFTIFYAGCLLYFIFINPNFFNYYRVIGYSIWLWLLLFVLGIMKLLTLLKNKKTFLGVVFAIILWRVLIANYNFLKNVYYSNLLVDDKLASLQELDKNSSIKEPIFTADALSSNYPLWNRFWTLIFLRNQHVVTSDNVEMIPSLIKDGGLYLAEKNSIAELPTVDPIWENNYWRLGRLCFTDDCLLSLGKDFLKANFSIRGDQVMLTEGWSKNEVGFRWIEGKTATLRFFNQKPIEYLQFTVQSLTPIQQLTILSNGREIIKTSLNETVQEKKLRFSQSLKPGVHYLVFQLDNTAQPSDVDPNSSDTRTLSAKFSQIKLY